MNARSPLRAALLTSTLLLLAETAAARDLYVATTGDDDASGAEGAPWRSLAKAAAEAGAGDTVHIGGGTYAERLIPRNSGTADARVRFVADAGAEVVLEGSGLSGQGVIYLNGVEYVEVAGLTVQHAPEAGIWVIDSSYVWITGNRTYDTVSSGIIVSEFGVNDHVYIDSNDVELCCNDGGQECISISKCDVFEVTRNHVHHGGPGTAGGEGIDTKFGSSNGVVAYNYVHHLSRQGLYADAWSVDTHDIEFYGNVVHDCQFGAGVASEQGGGLYNISFHDNLVYDTDGPGLYILMSAGPLQNLEFANNTVHGTGRSWGAGLWLNGSDATDVLVRNNVFSGLAGEPFFIEAAPASWTLDHNLAARAQSGVDGIVIGSPSYVDEAGKDFHLAEGSPGMDAGSQELRHTVDLDLAGDRRVRDGDCNGSAEIDLGAYEYASACDSGGSGGAAGSGGNPGGAGGGAAEGGSAGASSGGSGGAAIGGDAGTTAGGGAPPSGGAPAVGGGRASGGATPSGGTPSSGGATTGGGATASGGAAATGAAAGAGGSAGTPDAGGSATGAASSIGGSAAITGGQPPFAAGAEGASTPEDSREADGCGCATVGSRPVGGLVPSAFALALLLARRARSRQRLLSARPDTIDERYGVTVPRAGPMRRGSSGAARAQELAATRTPRRGRARRRSDRRTPRG